MTKKITMQDLAREAGCSRPQVSRAFNGQPNVSPEIRARVLAAAERLNYRNTANRHKVRIVVIVRDTSGMYGPLMLDALVKNACARKWVCHTVFEQNIHEIPDCFYDGAVSLIFNKDWARKWVEERATPLVMINSYGTAFDKICSIDPDSSDGSRIVLQHLQQLGHRRIARIHFVDAEEEKYRRGQEEFLREAARLKLGDSVRNFQFVLSETSLEDGIKAVLSQGFTAIHMIHQSLGIPAAKIIQDAGYRIPEDVSLVTFELPNISRYLTPAHTTIDFDYRELARQALDELHLRMHGKGSGGGAILVPNLLHIRDSTGPCRA